MTDVIIFCVLVVAIDLGSSLVIDEQSLLGGLAGILGSLVIAWVLLLWRGQRWRDVGLRRPKPFWMLPIWACLIAVLVYYSQNYAEHTLGNEANLERFAVVEGNLALYLQLMVSIWITAALIEEIIYRGFLLSRLAAIFGSGFAGLLMANMAQAIIFGAIHWYQGFNGFVLTALAGFIFGAFYLLTGRNLWPLILAHGIANSIALTSIFLSGV